MTMINSVERTNTPRLAALVGSIAVLGALSGCGGLEDGDEQVCDAAKSQDPYAVYDVGSLAEDDDITKQVGRIKPGSSDANDTAAMKEIVKLCEDKGYEPSA